MLNMFKDFITNPEAWDMFVTGRAGTGKTTGLAKVVQYCIDGDIDYLVCAYTHKACSILADKLPPNANISTLHSWLKKRPGINTNATKLQHIDIRSKQGDSLRPSIVFIDEYSMIGEQDLMDIRALQDGDYDAIPEVKVCWLGDPYQLPPVGDMQSVRPFGQYSLTLDTVYRQAQDNPLKDTLELLVEFIQNGNPHTLPAHSTFTRGADIVEAYKACKEDKVMLAYTNQQVEHLNASVQGRTLPEVGDTLFSPTTRKKYYFLGWADPKDVTSISKPFGDDLHLNSKYKTLEYLLDSNYRFIDAIDEDGNDVTLAIVFGHYSYKQVALALKQEAASSNLAIETKHKGTKAATWAKANPQTVLARERAKAWRDFLCFDECVVCVDFAHAMTVHKSQGSTYTNVFIDGQDLARCTDFNLYLRLMYVAVSRASQRIVMN